MFVLKTKKVIIACFLALFVAVVASAANDPIMDDLGLLPKGAYKTLNKAIKATSKKLKTDISIIFVKDEDDVAEENLASEFLEEKANGDKGYEGIALIVVLDKKDEVSTLYMGSMGKNSEKAVSEKRQHYVMDAVYDLAFEAEEYEDGVNMFLKMVELFFEYAD